MQWNFIIVHIIFVKLYLCLIYASSNNEPQVAFNCGRPANVFQNKKWTLDFQQDCIKDEVKVVQFCQKSFPSLKILTAEPAIKKEKFTNWCDFNNQSCAVDIEIRPFKCLDKNFQSDALILPRNCQFGHLFNESECLIYRHWVKKATDQCIQKQDWIIKSYGMLFPCGNNVEKIKPMYFKGVEFVCCPNHEPKINADDSDLKIYKNYLNNAVLDTEQGEQKLYENAEKKLLKSENEKETEIINAFKESEQNLEKLWKTDPKYAEQKEQNLHKDFKTAFTSIQKQFEENKESLLNFHDNRLEFIFNTKFEATKRNLEQVLQKSDKNIEEIFEAMKSVLVVLMDRKKYLMAEFEEAQKLGTNIANSIYNRTQIIDKYISDLFESIKQVPNSAFILKRRLMNYFTNVYPQVSKPIDFKHSIYDQDTRIYIQDIISKYRHREKNQNSNDNGFSVHYDLGLNDPDQIHADFGKLEKLARHENEKNSILLGTKSILGIVFGLMSIILLCLVGFVLYQRRLMRKGYSSPISQNEGNGKMFRGFGSNQQCTISKESKPHFYENMNYVSILENPLIQTKLEIEEKS